jgi:uncharacterized protein (DUF302 family)
MQIVYHSKYNNRQEIQMKYYFNKSLAIPFDEAVSRVTEELKKEGFGILTEIDVKETLKKKLDVDFKKYKILGACNPHFASRSGGHRSDGIHAGRAES